jgi:hypothetical protein
MKSMIPGGSSAGDFSFGRASDGRKLRARSLANMKANPAPLFGYAAAR